MRKRFYFWFLTVLTVISLLLGATTLMGCGASANKAISEPNPALSLTSGGASQEGIEVHGHWTIEVRNPDGTLGERREFDNALTGFGSQTLASILGRQSSVGGWTIQLLGSSFTGRTTDGRTGAIIAERTYFNSGTNIFKNLTVTAPAIGDVESQPLRLAGTATAEVDYGGITEVRTTLFELPPDQAPSSASSSVYVGGTPFTSTILESPVSLSAGQTVTVTVVITFSSPH